MILSYTLYEIAAMFFIYSFMGWCIEVIYCGLDEGHFINRGFLNGPVCPIYGAGGVCVILCLTPIKDNLVLLFIGSALLTSAMELITGYLLNRIFHARWWDYSDMPFNLGGYICLKFSIIWGIICVALMTVIHPFVMQLIHIIPEQVGIIAVIVLGAIFIADVIVTVVAVNNLTKYIRLMGEVGERIHAVSDEIGESIYDSAAMLKEKAEELNAEAARYKRIVKAFPKLRVEKYNDQLEKIKNKFIKK